MEGKQKLMLEAFLRACIPLVKKALSDHMQEFCTGCLEGKEDGHLCRQPYYPGVTFRLKFKLAPHLLTQDEAILRSFNQIMELEWEKFRTIELGDFLTFYAHPRKPHPLKQLCYDTTWWDQMEDIMMEEYTRDLQQEEWDRDENNRRLQGELARLQRTVLLNFDSDDSDAGTNYLDTSDDSSS